MFPREGSLPGGFTLDAEQSDNTQLRLFAVEKRVRLGPQVAGAKLRGETKFGPAMGHKQRWWSRSQDSPMPAYL
jgi:hypothetical protein